MAIFKKITKLKFSLRRNDGNVLKTPILQKHQMQLKNIVKHLKVGYSSLLRYFNPIHKVITVNNRCFSVNVF